jgi:hypothetical protein
MQARISGSILVLLLAFSWGCSSNRPVHPDPQVIKGLQGKKVGVILLSIPPGGITEGVTTTRVLMPPDPQGFVEGPWRDDAEYQPIRLAEMKPLQQAVVEGGSGEFSLVQDMFVEGFRMRGVESFKVDRPVAARGLPVFKGGSQKKLYPAVDYRYLGKGCGADFLMVIELEDFGPYCHYTYASNDYTEVRAEAEASLIDTNTNRILWKTGRGRGKFRKEVEASCGREEHIPIITGALDELLSQAASALYLDFFATWRSG